jgi:hypothetical protein
MRGLQFSAWFSSGNCTGECRRICSSIVYICKQQNPDYMMRGLQLSAWFSSGNCTGECRRICSNSHIYKCCRSVVRSFCRSVILKFCQIVVLSLCWSVVLSFCRSFFVGVARRKRNLVSIYRRSDLTSQRLAEDLILTNHIRHLPAEQNVLPYILLLQYLLYNLRTPRKL